MSFDYLADQGITSPRVLAALRRVPRARFVPDDQRARALENRPLPIGRGQTISQPFIVGFMTQQLHLRRTDRVLEVGTGSGYQAAVLAELSDHVFSVEIIASLAVHARETLDALGYGRVHTRIGNGRDGWPQAAPFDAIIVTAAGERIPLPLIDQLAAGGRLIAPVGSRTDLQELVLLRRAESGRLVESRLIPVRFVPLTE